MALQVSWESPEIGATFPKAYARIIRFRGNASELEAIVAVHSDVAARRNAKNQIAQMSITIPLPKGAFDPMAELYAAIKARDEFKDGVDV